MVGFYANFEGPLLIERQADRSLTIKQYNAGLWDEIAPALKRRLDGTFASDAQPLTAYWAFNADGRRYLASRTRQGLGHYLSEIPYAQGVAPGADLSPAWQARAGQRWLVVNESAESVLLLAKGFTGVTLDAVEGLPGYLLGFAGIVDPAGSDTRARMFLQIPVNFGRDLDDVVIETRDGEEWVRWGGFLCRPQASVPVLTAGDSAVSIGSEGFTEWRRLPAAGSVFITGASAWKLYDASLTLLKAGEETGHAGAVPAGSYLMVYGAPNSAITVTVMP